MNGPPSSGQRRERRQPIEPRRRRDALGDRARRHPRMPTFSSSSADVARAPQLAGRRRQQRLGQLDEASNQPERPLAERQLGAPRGAEQVGDQPEVAIP